MYLLNNRMSHLPSYRVGKQGEDEVVSCILTVLDSRWVVFRNLVLPGQNNGDIDIVLVGPGGIWAFEVKTYTGNHRVEKGSWYRQASQGHWVPNPRGPGAQLMTNAALLCNHLKNQGIVWKNGVKRAVVPAGEANIQVISSGTRVWPLDQLPKHLSVLNKGNTLDIEQIRNITNVLQRAAEYSRNQELLTTARPN